MKTIVTAALNGATLTRGACPAVPYSPQEIAEEAGRAVAAGASIVHVVAREDGGAQSFRVERYREVVHAIRQRCEVLVSVSTAAFGVGLEDRAAPLEARPDLAQIPIGTWTMARYNPRQRDFDYDHVFANSFADVRSLVERARAQGATVVAQCRDLGHLAAVEDLAEMGVLAQNVPTTLILGATGGMRATPLGLGRMVESAPGSWSVAVLGPQWPLRLAALAFGGHLRVGFEDSVALPDGEVASSNGALVTATVKAVRAVGGEVATVAEARALMGIGDDLGGGSNRVE